MAGIGGLAVSALYLLGLFGAQKQAEFAYSWLFAFFFFFTLTNGGHLLDHAPARLQLRLERGRAPLL